MLTSRSLAATSFSAPPFAGCVLQIIPEMDTGGVEQTTVDVSAAIIKAGGRSVVATFGGRLTEQLVKDGAVVIILPVHSKNPFTQWQNYFAIRRIIRDHGVDIVHIRSRAPALAGIQAARRAGIRSVTTYHGIYNAKSAMKRWYNSLMTKADMTIANSDFTRQHILDTYDVPPEHVISIPRGIDMKRFDPEGFDVRKVMKLEQEWGLSSDRSDDKRTRFLLSGRLTRWKGQTLIIEAAYRLKQQGIDQFQVLIAGSDQGRSDYTKELFELIAAYRLEDHVKLVGHCSDMPSAYSACDFALTPSLEPEAFGRTAVEPQAMMRPVLAAAHGALVETVVMGETGWLVPPGDPAAWATAMKTAMATTDAQRFAMGQKGRARVREHFSLDVMCERTLDVYRALLILNSRKYHSDP